MKPASRAVIGVVLLVVSLAAVAVLAQPFASAGSAGPGDANCDGHVNSIDGSLILQYSAGLIHSISCMDKADANGDGHVNSLDAAVVLQLDAGIIDHIGQAHPTASRTPTRTRTPPPQQPTNTSTPTRTFTPLAQQPTATSTSTPPMPTSAPTQTSAPPQGQVSLSHATWHTDSIGAIWVVGEVDNGLDHDVALVKVTASFYGASNQLLATEFGFACVNAIPGGGDSPFTVLKFPSLNGIDHVQVGVTDYISPPFLVVDPAVQSLTPTVTNVYTDTLDFRHAVGTVTNNSTHTYEFVQPCTAFYDSAGNVVRTDFTFAEPDTLGPGQVGTFDSFVDSEGKGIVSQRAWVTASYADDSPPGPSTPTPTLPPVPILPITQGATLVAADDQYLGVFTCNSFASDGIFNRFGNYGNYFSSTSIWNEFGQYGGQFGSYSPFNSFATPPVLSDGVGSVYLTVDAPYSPKVTPLDLVLFCFHNDQSELEYWLGLIDDNS
jgi:hypothetical protein